MHQSEGLGQALVIKMGYYCTESFRAPPGVGRASMGRERGTGDNVMTLCGGLSPTHTHTHTHTQTPEKFSPASSSPDPPVNVHPNSAIRQLLDAGGGVGGSKTHRSSPGGSQAQVPPSQTLNERIYTHLSTQQLRAQCCSAHNPDKGTLAQRQGLFRGQVALPG